jgi:SAM-dependent methyltransferase
VSDYRPSTYGDRIAEAYDGLYPNHDPEAIELLVELAGEGPVLELGVGTGRIALPLAARGLQVHGIDASEAMVNKLRQKPGGGDIKVIMGDFGQLNLESTFSLIFIAFNTFFSLQEQEGQVRCFKSVASHLQRGGRFVLEAFVPDVARFDRGQRVSTHGVRSEMVTLEVTEHDPARQRVTSQLVTISETGFGLYPVELRYAWPSELDLMARLADLELENRFANWDRQPFGSTSQSHVSVYRREA